MDMNPGLSAWGPILLQDFLRYFVTAGGFYLVFWVWKKRAWKHLRIQASYPDRRQMWVEMAYSMSTVLIFSLVGLFLFVSVETGWTRLYGDISERGWAYLVVSTALLVFIHDAYFYWLHRAMHLKSVYRCVHRVHHRSSNPTPWAAYSFHPLEAMATAAFFPLVVFSIPMHPLALFVFLAHMILRNVIGHLGYEFLPRGFIKGRWSRWSTTSTHHDMHHQYVHCHYGLYFTWWDELLGTTHPGYPSAFARIGGSKELPHGFEPSFAVKGGRVTTSNWSLCSSRSIVGEHGGHVELHSEEGKGTTVRIFLPV